MTKKEEVAAPVAPAPVAFRMVRFCAPVTFGSPSPHRIAEGTETVKLTLGEFAGQPCVIIDVGPAQKPARIPWSNVAQFEVKE